MSHEQHQHPFLAKNHQRQIKDDQVKTSQKELTSLAPLSASMLRLQRAIGNQAVMRLMNKTNNASSESQIPRRKVINEDVEINGELYAKEMDANEINGKQIGGDKGLFDVVKAGQIFQNGKAVRTEEK